MPIFINWFEVDVSGPIQRYYSRDFDSWDESSAFHDQAKIPTERFCRFGIQVEEKEVARTILFGKIETVPEKFELRDVDLSREGRVTKRVIEFNLGAHLAARGLRVDYNKFGVTATKPTFKVEDIGFCAEVGIEFKAYYLHYRRQHGITLDWKVRQFFDRSLDALPDPSSGVLLGLPVILRDDGSSKLDDALKVYEGRYLGVVTTLEKDQAEVLCRDGQRRKISKKVLLPEAKAEVVASLAGLSKEQRGTDSIQRRVMALSYSLTPAGRRNVKILQDKLRAAIDFLSPNNRPAVTVDFVPYCAGKMVVSTAPATAQVERG